MWQDELEKKYGKQLLALRGNGGCPADLTLPEMITTISGVVASDTAADLAEWLINVLVAGMSRWEDLDLLVGRTNTGAPLHYLLKYQALATFLRPLDRIKTIAELVTVVDTALGRGRTGEAGADVADFVQHSQPPFAQLLIEDSNFTVLRLLSYDGAVFWSHLWTNSSNGSWCTGWSENWYNNYTKQGPLFVVMDKTGVVTGKRAKWQLHVESDQLKDADDLEFDRTLFSNPKLFALLEQAQFAGRSLLRYFDRHSYLPAIAAWYAVVKLVPPGRHTEKALQQYRFRNALERQLLAAAPNLTTRLLLYLLFTENPQLDLVTPYLAQVKLLLNATEIRYLLQKAYRAGGTTALVLLAPLVDSSQLLHDKIPLPSPLVNVTKIPHQLHLYLAWFADITNPAAVGKSSTTAFINSLYANQNLLRLLFVLNKAQLDLLLNQLHQIPPKTLAFDPKSFVFVAIRSEAATLVPLSPYEDHDYNYWLLLLLGSNKIANPAAYSGLKKLAEPAYNHLVATILAVRYPTGSSPKKYLTELGRFCTFRPVTNPWEILQQHYDWIGETFDQMLGSIAACPEWLPIVTNLLAQKFSASTIVKDVWPRARAGGRSVAAILAVLIAKKKIALVPSEELHGAAIAAMNKTKTLVQQTANLLAANTHPNNETKRYLQYQYFDEAITATRLPHAVDTQLLATIKTQKLDKPKFDVNWPEFFWVLTDPSNNATGNSNILATPPLPRLLYQNLNHYAPEQPALAPDTIQKIRHQLLHLPASATIAATMGYNTAIVTLPTPIVMSTVVMGRTHTISLVGVSSADIWKWVTGRDAVVLSHKLSPFFGRILVTVSNFPLTGTRGSWPVTLFKWLVLVASDGKSGSSTFDLKRSCGLPGFAVKLALTTGSVVYRLRHNTQITTDLIHDMVALVQKLLAQYWYPTATSQQKALFVTKTYHNSLAHLFSEKIFDDLTAQQPPAAPTGVTP